ncbi:MAG: DNA helicase [Pseudomonadota bacterium]
MQFSAPIYRLKRRARLLARERAIPLHDALNRVAITEGFQSWSHLASGHVTTGPATTILPTLVPGELVLLGARPGHGKTRLGLEMAAQAAKGGRTAYFFTLDYHEGQVSEQLSSISDHRPSDMSAVIVDTSDEVCADYIIRRLDQRDGPAFVVVDYLQVLDQRRANPPVDEQISSLKAYVSDRDIICAVISQIDRSFDLSGKIMPDITDVRLPNPLDLSAFDRTCFLNDGKVILGSVQPPSAG